MDFERRIAEIYQSCRTPGQIPAAFDALQGELEEQIVARMETTRAQLLENFDEDVHRRLRMSLDAATLHLDRLGRALWELTRHELRDSAAFDEEAKAFELHAPIRDSPVGRYQLLASRSTAGGDPYRLGHPLAQRLVAAAMERRLRPAEVVFVYSGHPVRVSLSMALADARPSGTVEATSAARWVYPDKH